MHLSVVLKILVRFLIHLCPICRENKVPQENQEEQETQAVLVLRDQKEMRDHLVFKEKR